MGLTKWLGIGNTLYYPGCLTKVLGEQMKNYKKIFKKINIDFIMLPEEVCCGLPVLNAGYKKDLRKLINKNFELFKEKNIKKIITNCPGCYHTFKSIYSEIAREWDIEVEHASQTILKALQKKKIDLRNSAEKEIVSYHDPCHLGRYEKVYDEPREVIERLGGKIEEMKHSKEKSLCCGGGGGVRANFPKIAVKAAGLRAREIPKNATVVISPCGLCYSNLKSATDKSEEFSSFVLRKLEGVSK